MPSLIDGPTVLPSIRTRQRFAFFRRTDDLDEVPLSRLDVRAEVPDPVAVAPDLVVELHRAAGLTEEADAQDAALPGDATRPTPIQPLTSPLSTSGATGAVMTARTPAVRFGVTMPA